MSKPNPKVDAYISQAAEFAQPILRKIRSLFHEACPDIEETMKWSFPHFDYRGVVGSMAAFKQHVRFGFWKGELLKNPDGRLAGMGDTAMAGERIEDINQLPPDKVILAWIREAVALNENGVKLPPKKKTAKPAEIVVPDDLKAALKKNKKALTAFEAFSPSHKREYIEWITEAKQEATRQKRLVTAIEWMAEGKSRHWKYQTKK